MLEQELITQTLKDLYDHILPHMQAEQPKKLHGEIRRIYNFGSNSFQIGFLYGLQAGIGVKESVKVQDKHHSR